jgi:hypothetical protein
VGSVLDKLLQDWWKYIEREDRRGIKGFFCLSFVLATDTDSTDITDDRGKSIKETLLYERPSLRFIKCR